MYKSGVFFKLISFILPLVFVFPLSADAAPSVSAKSAILINAQNGDVITEYNADEKRGMASTTKIMTAIVAIENGNLNQKYTVPDAAIGIEGSSLYLKKGEQLTLHELLVGLMLRSANDAAEAIAIIIGGSVENFVNMMNDKAQALGLGDTHFTNPHGLANDNHYTTARELATITAFALKNDTFKDICSIKSAELPGTEYPRIVANHNKLLSIYDGAYGVKTGFTKATGRCLVSAANRNGVDLIAVTLSAPDDWNDHTALLDYGFSLYESVTLAPANKKIYDLPILGGDAEFVSLYIKNNITATVKKKRGSIVERVELVRPKFAPVYQDDELGRIVFLLDGIEIASAPLYASVYVGRK